MQEENEQILPQPYEPHYPMGIKESNIFTKNDLRYEGKNSRRQLLKSANNSFDLRSHQPTSGNDSQRRQFFNLMNRRQNKQKKTSEGPNSIHH